MDVENNENKKSTAVVRYPTLLGMAYRYKKSNGTWAFGINYIRLVVVMLLMLVVTWGTISIFLYSFMKHYKKYSNMTFLDAAVMPFDRRGIAEKQGDFDIEKAEALLKEGDYTAARICLISGTARSTKNLKGRKMLAEFYLRLMGRPDFALQALEIGIPYALKDLQYVRFYFSILMEESEDVKLAAVGKKILSSPEASTEVKLYVAMSLGTIYALHGDYQKSDEYLTKNGLQNSLPGVMRLSKNKWEQGRRDEAIAILKAAVGKVNDVEPIYAMLMSYYADMGQYDTARQYAVMRSVEKPFSVSQRIDYLKILKKTGEDARVNKELRELYEQNKSNETALLYLANYAADNGDMELMNKIYNTSIENNYSQAPFTMLMIETLLMRGKSEEAIVIFDEIMKKKPSWLRRYGGVFGCLRAAAYYGAGNTEMATILVDELLKKGNIPPRTLIATARRFDKMGSKVLAHKILVDAVERNPRHQLALTRLVQMEISMGNSTNLDKHIFKLIQMRRPPRRLIMEAKRSLESDLFIFTTDREKVMNEIDVLLKKESDSGTKVFSDLSDSEEDSILIN